MYNVSLTLCLRDDITVAVSFVSFKIKFQNVCMILIKMKLFTFMILSHKCSIVFVKVFNTLIRQGFSRVLKARKLSDLCFKINEKSLN